MAAADADVAAELGGALDTTMAQIGRLKTAAEAGFSYDMMLARGNAEGRR